MTELARHPEPRLLGGMELSRLLDRPGVSVVLTGGRSADSDAVFVIHDRIGPDLVLRAPTTAAAQDGIQREGRLLAALRDRPLGRVAGSVPEAVGFLPVDGRPALLTTAVPGTPMAAGFHGWRHTARPKAVRADFAAAKEWLADLWEATAGRPAPVTLLWDALDECEDRFPALGRRLRDRLGPTADRLAGHRTPRTVVHGEFWFGNLLLTGGRVTGVVEWKAAELSGEPLRDVARFAVSYALCLDRHVRPGRRVPGHPGLVADRWGAGLAYAFAGGGWFADLVRDYLGDALHRLRLPPELWRDVLVAGVADVAATTADFDSARDHWTLLSRITRESTAPLPRGPERAAGARPAAPGAGRT
ncbi:hypothetical protein [Polymorphospora sp. NPDC050346]|uniref:phosphotransferase family protein n=1 Tax=Polymorphospora sp. NPDC050346 TaxID=3155780 RepID=UPI0033E11130